MCIRTNLWIKYIIINASQFQSVYGNLRALLVSLLKYHTLPFKWPGYSKPRRSNTFSSSWNYYLYFLFCFSISRRSKYRHHKLDQLDVCMSYCALHFNSITNKYTSALALLLAFALNEIHINTMHCIADRKGKSFRCFFRCWFHFVYLYAYFNFSFRFCCRQDRNDVFFCWLDQHE